MILPSSMAWRGKRVTSVLALEAEQGFCARGLRTGPPCFREHTLTYQQHLANVRVTQAFKKGGEMAMTISNLGEPYQEIAGGYLFMLGWSVPSRSLVLGLSAE